VAVAVGGRMCLRYDFRNQNSARIGINLLPNVIKLFSDRTCIFHARSFCCSLRTVSGIRPASSSPADAVAYHLPFSFYYYDT